jgi:hypothetical protein
MGRNSLEIGGLGASCRDLGGSGGNTPGGIRTSNLRFRRPMRQPSKVNDSKALSQTTSLIAHSMPTDTCQTDPDLTAVVDAWHTLPDALRSGIVAMVKAASGK